MTTLIIIGLAVVLFAAFTLALIKGGQRYHWPEQPQSRPFITGLHTDLTARARAADHAERLAAPGATPWPDLTGPPGPFTWDDDCANPPCSPEDNWVCNRHNPAPSLGYQCGCIYWMPVYQPCPAHEAIQEVERGLAQ